MGAAVAVADFDRDGWQDFYVTNSGEGSLNRLYRNNGDGTFNDVAGADGRGRRQPARHRRVDGRGVGRLRQRRLRRPARSTSTAARSSSTTIEGQRFVAVGERAGLPAWVNANSATWLDYDRDGRLDLFIAGYWADDVNLWKLETTKIMPESFEYANNGGRKYLLRNRGDGTFEDVTEALGITSRRWTLAVIAADLRGTGYPDLFLSPTTTACRSCSPIEGGKRLRRRGADDRRRPHAEERHERVGRRRLQRRPPGDLQDEHLGARRARAGQRPVGAETATRGRRRRVREPGVEPGHRLSAAGAGARSSAT